MSEQKIGYKSIFKQKEYMKLILASVVNRFGDSIDAIALTWLVYELSGSAAWSALIFGVNKIPTILIMPFAGAYVEGRRKKRIMIVTDVVRAVLVAALALFYMQQILTPEIMLIITFLISTAEAFRIPASTALTPKLLELKYMEYGMSLSGTISEAVELVGTLSAAGIIAFLGIPGAIMIDMVTFFLSAFIIAFIHIKENIEKIDTSEVKGYWNTLKDGFVYTRKNKVMQLFLVIAIYLNAILVPINCLQAPMFSEILRGGSEMLSLFGVTVTLGMLLGTLTFPKLYGKFSARVQFFTCGAIIGIFYIAMILMEPLFENKIVAYGYVAVGGTILSYMAAFLSSYLSVEFVKKIDGEYLARTSALMNALGDAATPVVSWIISAVVVYMNCSNVFLFIGILDIVVCILITKNRIFSSVKEEKLEDIVQKEKTGQNEVFSSPC